MIIYDFNVASCLLCFLLAFLVIFRRRREREIYATAMDPDVDDIETCSTVYSSANTAGADTILDELLDDSASEVIFFLQFLFCSHVLLY